MSQLKGTKIVITGGNGFVGSHLTRRIVREGARICVIAKPGTGVSRIKDLLPEIEIREIDIENSKDIFRLMRRKKPDKVFHLAAYGVDQSVADVERIVQTNVVGTLNVVQSLKGLRIERFINFGTCFEYGDNSKPVKEDAVINPVNFYSASKSAAWLFLNLYSRLEKFPVVTVRPFSIYGPSDREDKLIPSTIIKTMKNEELLFTGGKQKRDYIYVDDIVEGCLKAAVAKKAIGETINLGTGKVHSIKEIVTLCLRLMGSPIKPKFGAYDYRPNEIFSLRADIKKAEEILGWRYAIELEEGLRRMIKWYGKNYHEEK